MEAEYVRSLVETTRFLTNVGISFLYLNQYNSMVTTAREATIMGSNSLNIYTKQPLNGAVTYDKLIWIDSDISWTIQDFMKLYNAKQDIIAGLYFDQNMTPMCAKNGEGINLSEYIQKEETVEVDAVGFGFVSMKQGVFENVKRPWFETKLISINPEDESIKVPLGEDFSWCYKAKDAGYKIFLDTSILLTHYKKIPVGITKEDINANTESDTTL